MYNRREKGYTTKQQKESSPICLTSTRRMPLAGYTCESIYIYRDVKHQQHPYPTGRNFYIYVHLLEEMHTPVTRKLRSVTGWKCIKIKKEIHVIHRGARFFFLSF